MKACEPIFLGFLPKKIITELKGMDNLKLIGSVSSCIANSPPDMYSSDKPWNYNKAAIFDTEQDAEVEIPQKERDKYRLFAYKTYNLEIDKNGVREIDIGEKLPKVTDKINPNPDLTDFVFIGYDLVQEINVLHYGCSPLSCNGLFRNFEVNEYCLMDEIESAVNAAMKFEEIGAEPPPYYLFEVYMKCIP
ncbi:hypothetical protein GF312_09670 [Candidatus Poribacteria bacterium]|nr:hypothetical protein [Candidatus Poribacteria bacterium]